MKKNKDNKIRCYKIDQKDAHSVACYDVVCYDVMRYVVQYESTEDKEHGEGQERG